MPDRERLIQLIYDGVLDDAAWTAALAMVAGTVRLAGAGLGVQDMTTQEFWAVPQSGAEVSVGTGSSLDLSWRMSVDGTLVNAGTVSGGGATLSGGSVTIEQGAIGNNAVSAARDTTPSAGKAPIYIAGGGIDSFTGGFENDTVAASATALVADTLTGGTGTNTLMLTRNGTFNLGGVSNFATVGLASGNNTVTVTDMTLSGGSVTIEAEAAAARR